MTPSALTQFLSFSIENNFPVLITGKPGIGKSDIVTKAAKEANAKLIVSHPVVSDPTDYKGLPFADSAGKEAHFLPFGELNALIQAKEKTVFFLDDLGQAPTSVQAACMQLILSRSINGFKISDTVTFIAATNRKSDHAGVSGILEPVKSRFASIVELEIFEKDWVEWAIENGMPVELISFVRFKTGILEKGELSKEIKNTISPRTVTRVGAMQNAGLPKNIEAEVFQGACGEIFAAEYCAFLSVFRSLPNIEEIILNPDKAPIANEASIRWALCGLVAAKANKENWSSLIRFIKRFPKEMQAAIVADIMGNTKTRELSATMEFINWAQSMGNLITGKN